MTRGLGNRYLDTFGMMGRARPGLKSLISESGLGWAGQIRGQAGPGQVSFLAERAGPGTAFRPVAHPGLWVRVEIVNRCQLSCCFCATEKASFLTLFSGSINLSIFSLLSKSVVI